ncbi:MAG: alpha-glucosidase/alpha-galactosidase [Candidatus Latescibacterota bacterium]|jgi:alpha-galactosidase
MPLKIAVIGAGSIGFTRRLMQDILSVPEFQDTEFAFHDVNRRNLEMIAQLARRDIAGNGLPARLTTSLDRRQALTGADYVLNTTRIGGLKAFQTDIDIPLKYGVDQCVGDTLSAGGIMYGQRNIPQILAFCRDLREKARPGALFLNYANPMAMNTWAGIHHGGVRMVGLCHGVQGGHHQIAQVIELLVNKGRQPGSQGYRAVPASEVDIVAAGINHQTWYIKVQYDGTDWTGRLLEGFERHPIYSHTEKVRIDVLRRFGYYSTESNGHLSEYLPWYRKRPREIRQWIDLSSWINGETGGYLRVCTEGRNWFSTDFPNWLKQDPPRFTYESRSHEHGSWIIEALETGRVYRGHFNVPNQGTIPNLPAQAIVEVPGYVDRNGINVPRVGDLPLGCAALCRASISVQELSVEAAVRADLELLRQAFLMDPLVGAVCSPPEVEQMVDEMLVAQAEWLPQWRTEIGKARKRLAGARRLGTSKSRGAARLQVKSVARMRQDQAAARQRTAAAGKGKVAAKKKG